MTLTAVLHGYENVTYHLQWQVSTDGTAWTDMAGETGTTTTVLVTEENYLNYWRVLVTANDANTTDAE